MSKPRILYILCQYPQLSETYIRTEIEALRDDHEIRVITMNGADLPYKDPYPYARVSEFAQICEAAEAFRPHVLHSHWLTSHVQVLAAVARHTQTPFTVRAHSFDAIWKPRILLRRLTGYDHVPSHIRDVVPLANDDLCLGIVTFPFTVPHLERAGVRRDKLHMCYPVINYARFHDPSPNGPGVMNTGACLPKKKFEDYLGLARSSPQMEFNLYPVGYEIARLKQANEAMGNPVKIMPPIEPDEMPREYKKHRWLVYTASREIGTVGWSLSIAEAQAAGVGVCAPNIRPDMREYVGACGFLYDSISDVPRIIAEPFAEDLRQMGFEHAKKSDIAVHKHVLTDLWAKAIVPR